MTPGMKIVQVSRGMLHSLQIITHCRRGERPDFRVCRASIQGVRRMGKQGTELMFIAHLQELLNVLGVDGLRLAPSWIPGKKLEYIRSNGQRILTHLDKSIRHTQVTTYQEHRLLLQFRFFTTKNYKYYRTENRVCRSPSYKAMAAEFAKL